MRLELMPPGKGFDASTYIPPDQLNALWAKGYRFRIAYLRRDQHVNIDAPKDPHEWPVSMSRQELDEHLAVGFRVGFYQFGRFHGRNYLSSDAGKRDGYNAAWNARKLTGLDGVSLFVDAEWTDNPPKARVMAYLRSWGQHCSEADQRAACYRAWEGLGGSDWYSLPYFRSYCASAMHSALRTPPLPRGDAVYQRIQTRDCGAVIDPCYCVEDLRGDRPWVVAP